MQTEITTTKAVIEALGGTKAVAALTGRTYAAAFNWRRFKSFPANTFLIMTGALKEHGFTASAALWGMHYVVHTTKPSTDLTVAGN